MADYYGATANPNYGYSPYSGQTHYGSYPPSQTPFTGSPGGGNTTGIEEIRQRIRNMHPEQMAALADQWQNAWSFMADVKTFLLNQSNVLRDEAWQSPAARDAFLRRGPGETLAYLDVWMDAAQQNVTALRHMVNVSTEARYAMERLVRDYEDELREAQNVDFLEHVGAFFTEGVGWDAARLEEIEEDQSRVQEKYRYEAQKLAFYYGDQFFDYIGTLTSGVGPPVQPMNAVLSQPAALPGGGGLPGGQGPAQLGPGFQPLPVGNPPAAQLPPGTLPPGQLPPGLLPPGVALPLPVAPGTVPPGSLPPGVTPPGTLPPGLSPGLPAPIGQLPPGVLPPAPGTLPPGTLPPGTLPPGTLPPGSGPSVIPPGSVRPGLPPQLGRPGRNVPVLPGGLPPGRTIRRPSAPSAPVVPPGGREIRRTGPATVPPTSPAARPGRTTPGVTPPPARTGRPGRTTPGVTPPPGQAGRPGRTTPGVTPPPGRTSAPGVTPPGQTGRPGDRGRGRPGTPARPTGSGVDAFGRPPGQAAPPVLKNPGEGRGARPGSEAEMRRPAAPQRPGGTAPPVLNRPTSPAAPPPYRPTRRDRGLPPWSDLFGAEEARRRGGSGVIDAPERARPDGGPWGLRSRAATRPETPAEPNRPGTVAPELGRRRGGGEPVPVREDHDLVTDQQAFGVRTPGGNVVTGRGEEPPEQEIRRAFRS
ncbi:hypothetical protein GCM10010112_54700 [Actinoplanes lobatus]|uniref:Uncharacterized protein n=1 Tax=Actinoplanes lobatus TaxID=113568 RepID=A0A7W7MGI0_9ACTN|nr:hypothetical protein [Actinoplanes lobatus]MBB4749311.1 hypothetical protein [Actinoplanes lobatus]GGN79750.1 hypothetical protein GCM10010112_54700 [Actinoplanes lobatus]GIE40250.1 hypothetical protein Alo02nite_31480 [Actinoplanes lobatus]